ncbi:MAG: HNH endonuclease family protein [Thermodesulfobacteriota bacterium]
MLNQRAVINDSPQYQREAAIWSEAKQQLFIDTILNGYDVPKLYFHDVSNDKKTHHKFAVVDGKQRLYAIWNFLCSEFVLGQDVEVPEEDKGLTQEKALEGQKFSELNTYWQGRIEDYALPIVQIQDATEDDIEELFSRLNNGEPLSGAEKRNAMSGKMCRLISQIGKTHSFFKEHIGFSTLRLQHFECSAKFILMEHTASSSSGEIYCILKKRFLDEMTKCNKNMTKSKLDALRKAVSNNLNAMTKIFNKKDPLLRRSSSPQLYYAFCRETLLRYGHRTIHTKIHKFLEQFQGMLVENRNNLDEEKRNSELLDFELLMSQNNDKESMRKRVEIMTRYFLEENPDVEVKDSKRFFNQDERYVVWIRGNKKCAECEKELAFDKVEADHIKPHSQGGKTILQNACALCKSCNTSFGAKTRKP